MRIRHCRACGAIVGRDLQHPCPAYRSEPEGSGLTAPTDPTFIRESWNTADGLGRYRKGIK